MDNGHEENMANGSNQLLKNEHPTVSLKVMIYYGKYRKHFIIKIITIYK